MNLIIVIKSLIASVRTHYKKELSEEFIKKHYDKVTWSNSTEYQKLSENSSEKLSEEFIKKHYDKVTWSNSTEYQKLSDKYKCNRNTQRKLKRILLSYYLNIARGN